MYRSIAPQDIMLKAAGMFTTDEVQNIMTLDNVPLIRLSSTPRVTSTKKGTIAGHPEVESMMFVLDGYLCKLFIAQILTIFMTLRVIIVSLAPQTTKFMSRLQQVSA